MSYSVLGVLPTTHPSLAPAFVCQVSDGVSLHRDGFLQRALHCCVLAVVDQDAPAIEPVSVLGRRRAVASEVFLEKVEPWEMIMKFKL